MKRTCLFLILCPLLMLFLAACRSNQPGESAPEGTANPSTTSTPATSRGEETEGEAGAPAATPQANETDTTTDDNRTIYSLKFDVNPDGFGFRNYGAGYPEGNFTIADLRELFGDSVCSRSDGEECIPSAEAQQWIDDRNADMNAGHCIGFTVTSYRFAQGELAPASFTTSASDPYDIEQQASIMRTIALNGSLYWVKSVWSSEVSGTPREIIDALIDLGEPVDLSIFRPGLVGGHSLLAYGVEQVDSQTYHILVYDNNFPGEEAYVEVDYDADTWRYDRGAVNPDEAAIPYEGDASTETLRFIPLSAYETATCPFCPAETGAEAADEPVNLLSFIGQGEVLVKTALGTISIVAGEIINDIPGAKILFQRGQLSANDTPDIVLPAGLDYTVEFHGLERVSSLGQDHSLVIDHLSDAPENSYLAVAAETQNVEFKAGGAQSPLLKVSIRQDDVSHSIALLGMDFAHGQGLTVGTREENAELELVSRDVEISDSTMLITRRTREGEAIFATTGLDIQDSGSVSLAIADWDGSGAIDLHADEDGDGTYDDRPVDLPNEPLDKVLEQNAGADGATIIGVLSPVLGDDGLDAVLANLDIEELSGWEIGLILQPLQLTIDRIVDFVTELSLPMPELADLLFALKLEAERLDTIIESLELVPEDEGDLRRHLSDVALFQEIISDWAFLNTDDLGQLVELLGARELTAEQLARLLPKMSLSESDLAQVLGGLDLSDTDLATIAEQLGIKRLPTRTPTPTATIRPTAVTSGTVTLTPTATPTIVSTTTGGLPTATPDPGSYPGPGPAPTGTPGPYPYPGPLPTATGDPDSYPGPTTTPEYQSLAYCVVNDLRIVAQEPTWLEETTIEVWAGEQLLLTGAIGQEGEPYVATVPGPDTWPDLHIVASEEPTMVPLGTISCPAGPEGDATPSS